MAFALVFWVTLAATATAGIVVAWRAQHGTLWTGLTLLVVAGIWIVAKVAYDHDWRDADGFLDCYPSCSAVQRGVGASLIGGAILVVVLIIALCIALVRRRTRH